MYLQWPEFTPVYEDVAKVEMAVESRERSFAFESRHILALALPMLLTRIVQRWG